MGDGVEQVRLITRFGEAGAFTGAHLMTVLPSVVQRFTENLQEIVEEALQRTIALIRRSTSD